MNALLILNDPPYGTERSCNALRLARSLLDKGTGRGTRVFLIGDADGCAHGGQKVPQGFYNIANMLGAVLRRGGEVGVWGTCMDARGITTDKLAEGTKRGSMDQLTEWTVATDKILVF